MKTLSYYQFQKISLKTIFGVFFCFIVTASFAQDKTKTIGNKPREGSANNSFNAVKGKQVGIRMNAGHKKVELLKLNFHCKNPINDSIAFRVNVYQMAGKLPADSNLVKAEIGGYIEKHNPLGNHLVSVDLSAYHVIVSGDILVSIEFLVTKNGAEVSFACGLLNGGTFYKDSPTAVWKKIPVVGADFNVLVKKLK